MNYNLIAFDEKVQILMDPPLSTKIEIIFDHKKTAITAELQH